MSWRKFWGYLLLGNGIAHVDGGTMIAITLGGLMLGAGAHLLAARREGGGDG